MYHEYFGKKLYTFFLTFIFYYIQSVIIILQ
jgi:hypothetical protein